jgi:dienelactone hydrolase
MGKFLLALLLALFLNSTISYGEKVAFLSKDGTKITADYYKIHPDTVPLIILFHQAGWSRGEYIEIAPRLNQMGFNCLAVDLRSGKVVNNVTNETYLEAKKKMKETNYLSSEIDMLSAIDYANNITNGKIILWGSSYSASLVLKTLTLDKDRIIAGLAFSPGEYFRSFGKPSDYIASYASEINLPVFITCAKREKDRCNVIFEKIPVPSKVFFVPESSGNHGSSALWNIHYDSKAYWEAVESFLDSLNN